MKQNQSSLNGKQVAVISDNQKSRELQPYYGQHYDVDEFEPEIDLAGILRVLKRFKVIIGSIFSVSLLIALVYTLILRPEYTATAFVELNTSAGNVVKFNQLQIENRSQGRYLSLIHI